MSAPHPAPLLRTVPPAVRRLAVALFAILAASVTIHLAYTCFDLGRETMAPWIDRWDVMAGVLAVTGLCWLRAAAVAEHRAAWLAMGASVALWALGLVYFSVHDYWLPEPPYPSWADAAWLAAYLPVYASIMLLVRAGLRRAHPSVWLDGLVGALALSALVVAMLLTPSAPDEQGTFAAVATNIAYPVADLLLLIAIVGVCALAGWRPARGWVVVGVALGTLGLSDTLFLFQLATETYELGTPLDSGWIVAFAILGLAAWQPPDSFAIDGRLEGSRVLVVPLVFVGLALGVLVAAEPLRLTPVAGALAAAAIVASAGRLWLSFREVQALAVARREADTDELTGLANRRRLFRELESALAGAHAGERELALLLIDLDGFKELNDTFGHHAGDLLLRQIGPRLRGVLPEAGVARLGGDEFAVVLGDRAGAADAAARLREALREPFPVLDVTLRIDASVGVARFPEHGTSAQALVQCADAAMYDVKRSRSGRPGAAPADDDGTRDRLALMSSLPDAIRDDELVLHFQPLVDVRSGAPVLAEALVRWQHPERGLLPPDTFLPLARQSAVMGALTLWVLDAALAECARWIEEGMPMQVAVNVSASDLLDARFAERVGESLARHGVAPGALQLEITEDGVMSDLDTATAVLARMRDMGIEIAIDDYGTGYSSLSWLKRLPVDALKIDRSFVTDLAHDRTDLAIVRSTVELARTLGVRVVAEGVEDDATLGTLADLGADVAQGYLFSRPLPAAELTGWLRAAPARAAAAAR